jgi:peptidoglycan/xylan/chitin deacetylase (PgdA/CDA1 family)
MQSGEGLTQKHARAKSLFFGAVIFLTRLAHLGMLRNRRVGSRLTSSMKRATRLVLTHPFLVRAALSMMPRVAPILMFHRFRDAEVGNRGHDPQALHAHLAWLRAQKFTLLSVTELLDRLAEGAPVKRTIAFTVDDGYADFGRIAAPIFAEFDCPVTVFLPTGFLDGQHWLWWDSVSLALTALKREPEVGPMVEALKLVPEAEKLERISALVRESGIELAKSPTPKYAPLTWDDVRRLSRSGVTFGPHTVTHPTMSRTPEDQLQFEIAESWRRVRAEAGAAAVPVFCYPNGDSADFHCREERAVAAHGMRAAMSARPGYASHRDFGAARPSARFSLPRFGYTEDPGLFIQVASGVEWAKEAVRAVIGKGRLKIALS